jgi:ATP-dependent DNA helicase PIF1
MLGPMVLIVKRLGQCVIEAKISTGNNVNKCMFIPRIIMSPSKTDWPFVLHHHQFPVQMAFMMTINKSQGQTLNNVGVYLLSPSLFPWLVVCCYVTGHKQCKHQDFQ